MWSCSRTDYNTANHCLSINPIADISARYISPTERAPQMQAQHLSSAIDLTIKDLSSRDEPAQDISTHSKSA